MSKTNSTQNDIEALKAQARELGYTSCEGLTLSNGEIVPRGKLVFDPSYDAVIHGFDNLRDIKPSPGLYQIFTFDGTPLKVGIATNLRSRLRQHVRSSQKYLKPTIAGPISAPNHLVSKQSILAKHLFFDQAVTTSYDLKTETGRQDFLCNETYLLITYTHSRDEAARLERIAEALDVWRYCGRVKVLG